MTAKPQSRQSGVVLAAEVGSYSTTTIALAVRMAASINTHLRGVFIEDEDLLQVVGLPCTREISLTTALERPTSVAQMQRALRLAAQQFRQILQQQALAQQIEWSFDSIRGRLSDIGLSLDRDLPYLILGHQPGRRITMESQPRTRRILVLAARSPNQEHALKVALDLFAAEKVELTLVDEASSGSLADGISGFPGHAENRISLIGLKRDKLFELLSRRHPSYDCAILPRHGNTDEIIRIMKSPGCPVILTA